MLSVCLSFHFVQSLSVPLVLPRLQDWWLSVVSSTAAQYASIAAHQRLMQFGIFVDSDGQIEFTQ